MSGDRDTRQAFLESIREAPEDDTPRLIFADWLEEHGEQARAEFIRLQCELARLPTTAPQRPEKESRERDLLRENRTAWLGPLAEPMRKCAFRRGFPEDLPLDPKTLIELSAELEQRVPVGRVTLRGHFRDNALEALASCPLPWVVGLKWESGNIHGTGFAALAASENLPRLEEWSIERSRIAADQIRVLANCPHRSALRKLSLQETNLSAEVVIALAGPKAPFRLHSLDLYGNRYGNRDDNPIGPKAAEALAQASHLDELRELNLCNCGIGDIGALALARSPYLKTLSRLNLQNNKLTSEVLPALVQSELPPGILGLTLGCNAIGDQGAEILAGSSRLARLERLVLYDAQIGDRGAEALAASPWLSNLIELDLVVNEIYDRGSQALFDSPHLARLQRIHLGSMAVREKYISQKQRKMWLQRLGKGARV